MAGIGPAGRGGLFNNSHFKIACLADPQFAPRLARRYENFERSVTPHIIKRVDDAFGGHEDLLAITFTGSSSCFRHYNDIDVAIVMMGKSATKEKVEMRMKDEANVMIWGQAEVFYIDLMRIVPDEYLKNCFSKPVLFGRVPQLYDGIMPQVLTEGCRGALIAYDVSANKGRFHGFRKALHTLVTCARYVREGYAIMDLDVPQDYPETVREMFRIEAEGKYTQEQLKACRAKVEAWVERLAGNADIWAAEQRSKQLEELG